MQELTSISIAPLRSVETMGQFLSTVTTRLNVEHCVEKETRKMQGKAYDKVKAKTKIRAGRGWMNSKFLHEQLPTVDR